MSQWRRDGTDPVYKDLLPFHVILTSHEWHTFRYIKPCELHPEGLKVTTVGADAMGDVFICPAYEEAMQGNKLFTAYRVMRRAIRPRCIWKDDKIQLTTVPLRGFVVPSADSNWQTLRVGVDYHVCVSFPSAKQAVTFRMMVQGIVKSWSHLLA